jgi:hypothetical protein
MKCTELNGNKHFRILYPFNFIGDVIPIRRWITALHIAIQSSPATIRVKTKLYFTVSVPSLASIFREWCDGCRLCYVRIVCPLLHYPWPMGTEDLSNLRPFDQSRCTGSIQSLCLPVPAILIEWFKLDKSSNSHWPGAIQEGSYITYISNTEDTSHVLLFKSSYAFRTQEWFNLARDDVVRLRRTAPLVSFFGWLVWLLGWYVSNRQIHDDFGIPFFADHIRALTESFDSKLADAGNPLVRQLGRTFANQGRAEVTYGQPMRSDAQQASRSCT